MASINDFMNSNYIKREDLGPKDAALVTFQRIEKKNVAQQGQPPEYKGVAYFNEFEKGFVMNKTNLQLAADVFGSPNIDSWAGKKIVVYWDPSVAYAGKLTGGMRLRKPTGPAFAPPPAQDDDIPF